VAAGLALINETKRMPDPESGEIAIDCTARVGVATSLVVVEDSKIAGRDVTIIGQAPRMASWLQGLAPADSVVIGPHTQRLVAGHFELEPAGTHTQTQFGDEVEVFQVETAVSLDGSFTKALALMGREEEIRLLQERWANVVDGDGQFVVLQGEPGIGKSSLLSSFIQHVIEGEEGSLIPLLCSPYDRNNPLTPVIEMLQHSVLDFSEQESNTSQLEKLRSFLDKQPVDTDEALPLLASLLSLDAGSGFVAPSGSAQIVRMQTMELVLDLISRAANIKPVLLVFEDLHWADPSTLEMIRMLVDRGPSPGLFVLFTARPAFKEEWTGRSYVLVQELLPLSRRSARELVENTAGETRLPEKLMERIIGETDGNPLFIRELTLAVLESDAWQASQSAGKPEEMTWLEIPATLQDSLTARLDNLGEAKALLQLCSVLGHEFIYDLLYAVSGTENEAALKQELADIVDAELLYQRGVLKNLAFTFKHILIQETAYNSLLKSKRRELHARTAQMLEQEITEVSKRQPALLAYHYTEAGDSEKAIPYWTQASRQSLAGFANLEAIEQAGRGIGLLQSMPESPQRAALEIPLQSVLGSALLSTRGYADPEVRKVFTRAQDLCEQIGDAPQLFQVVVGLWMYYIISVQLTEAFDLSQSLLRIAETTDLPAQDLQARYCHAFTLCYQADFVAAKAHLTTALENEVSDCDYAAQSASGDDTRIHVRVLLAFVNWHLGLPRTAAQLIKDANRIAKEVKHPWGITFAAFYSAWFHQLRCDAPETLVHANRAAGIVEENGFRFWMPLVGFMQTWAMNHEGGKKSVPAGVERVDKMKVLLEAYRSIGAGMGVTYLSFKLAEDYIALNMLEAGETELENGWQALQASGERFFEPEYYRLLGRAAGARYLESGGEEHRDAADKLFRQAVSTAQKMESRGLELRAVTDLAELLKRQGNPAEGARLLAGITRRFDELDDSGDCVRARKLLKKLNKSKNKAE
jgi:hypothetical protein